MKKFVTAAGIILVFGIVRIPLESRLDAQLRALHLREDPPTGLSLHEDLGQKGIAAAFGGLRPALSTFFYFESTTYFGEKRWEDLAKSFEIITQLQPRINRYWEFAIWHTAYNAASSNRDNTELPPVVRRENYRNYVARGVEFGEKGLRYLPDSANIHARLGDIYKARDPDPAKAANHYFMAYILGGGDYYERFVAFELVKLAGRQNWEQAYEILRRHYDDGVRVTSVIIDLKTLEKGLGIPAEDRIPDEAPEDQRDDRIALPDGMGGVERK